MKLLVLLGTLAALLGCGDAAKKKIGPLVTFEKGGGIASMPVTLVVQRDGRARVTVRTGPKVSHRAFRVGAGDLHALEAALDDARGVALPPYPGGCADCFTYAVHADGVDFSVDEARLGDGKVPGPLAALVTRLSTLAS